MRKLFHVFKMLVAMSAIAPINGAHAAQSNGFVTYVIHGESDGITENVPVTFGAIFAKGDVPPGSSVAATDGEGHRLPLQVDAKAKHFDGSLRHAVLTVIVPRLPNGGDISISLSRAPKSETAPLPLTALPANFDTVLTLKMKDGRQLRASARDLLKSSKPDLWLAGSQVTEWWVSGPLRDAGGNADPYLSVRFGIRSYGAGKPLRVEADVENTWAWVHKPRTEFYDATISANGKTVAQYPDLAQMSYTRWREVFWWDKAVTAYVEQNLAYMKKTRIVPNYVEDSKSAMREVENSYQYFQKSNRNPLKTGIVTEYMPMTGGRSDIAILPDWTATYLLIMDKRSYEMTLKSGDLAGSFSSHLRNTKTDRPVTAVEYPNLSTHSNFIGRPGQLEIPDFGGYKSTIEPQRAHEPSLAFIPYVVTGDRYYLEELEFWTQWNVWGTAPEYRGGAQALYSWDEVRGQAWSMRTLAQAAYIAPEADPQKAVLLHELKSNIDNYNKMFTNNPQANKLHAAVQEQSGPSKFAPWMDDYLTGVMGYIVNLGFDFARPFAVWKAEFPVQRMINKDFCWVVAAPYQVVVPELSSQQIWKETFQATFNYAVQAGNAHIVLDPASPECGSDQMTFKLGLKPGEMTGGQLGGYQENLKVALAAAVDLDAPGSAEAWDKFMKHISSSGFYPSWDIAPWPK